VNSFGLDGPRLAHRLMDQVLSRCWAALMATAARGRATSSAIARYPAPIASRQLSRRSVLVAAGTLAAATTSPTAIGQRMAETRANLSAQT
jgi:hypothetical protein